MLFVNFFFDAREWKATTGFGWTILPSLRSSEIAKNEVVEGFAEDIHRAVGLRYGRKQVLSARSAYFSTDNKYMVTVRNGQTYNVSGYSI